VPPRFSYYARLSKSQQATYRKSDAIDAIELRQPASLREKIRAMEEAHAAEKRGQIQLAAQALVDDLCHRLNVPVVDVRVLAVRPELDEAELHGLYTWEEGRRPVIRVWMRTLRHQRVVAFRTFVRTLLHELCHHLDFTLLELGESFHTQGFFRRESSLARQLLPRRKPKPGQLDLPID
jgi:hypothetical protein